jgi:hypothetical protein
LFTFSKTSVKGEDVTSPLTSCRFGLLTILQYTRDEAHGPGGIKHTDTCGGHLVDDGSILQLCYHAAFYLHFYIFVIDVVQDKFSSFAFSS